MSDPNKAIFMVDPLSRPNDYWGENLSEIQRIFSAKSFDNNHGRGGNIPSKKLYWEYTIDKIKDKTGLWLEFGVFEGTSLNHISQFTDQPIYGFDSFEGLPEKWYDDVDSLWQEGHFSLEGKLPKISNKDKLIPGWFENTLPKFVEKYTKKSDKISLLHIDCDLYSSTNTIFENIHHLIKKGTVIMFDEYWYNHRWQEHEFKSFQEFTKNNNINYEYIASTHRGCVSLIIK